MCGFAGIVSFDGRPIDTDRVHGMLRGVAHRGPDGSGVAEYDRCAMVHARLSIIDVLSGSQPMHVPQADAAGPLHLVFNGEIYNHRDLRKRLEKYGHTFRSDHSDTEVLLYGYRQWGNRLPKYLHGMFAFAVWDERERRLFLCRDRPGKKPLYLCRRDGEVMFGSLVSALVTGLPRGESPKVNPEAMLHFLRLGYPLGESMVQGITELPPAHWMSIDYQGVVQCERYWRPPPTSKTSTALGAVDALREVLREAVEQRLEADVPLGCFLSGGVDSSVIAALAQKTLTRRDAGPLRTFSVSMPDIAYDESRHAKAVAQHIGADHTVLVADPADAIVDLTRLMAVSGEPTADSSLLPTYWLCKAASSHVKAALAGDGGDELFGGYDRYRALRYLQRYRGLIAALPPALLRGNHPKSRLARMRRLVHAARAGTSPARQYQQMIHLFTDPEIAGLNLPGVSDMAGNEIAAAPAWPDEPDPVHAAMRWDLVHYLPFELLRKVDRASMAVPLEVRCPLLATPVCDLAGHLPTRVLMPGNRPKGLLRAVAASELPVSIVNRKKMGFAVPIGRWFREGLRDPLADLLLGGGLDKLGFEAKQVQRYFDQHMDGQADHAHRLFALLQLALWQHWLEDPRPAAPLAKN